MNDQSFENTGGLGLGPCGSEPFGSSFNDENIKPARTDILSLQIYYENESLVVSGDE